MTTTYVSNHQTSTGLSVSSGDELEVEAGGSAVSTTVTTGGTVQVDPFGSASFTTVSSGGSEIILGQVTSTVLSNGGSATVSSGATATDTIVSSGGRLTVSGGNLGGTSVGSGGYLAALGSATYFDLTVDGGSAGFLNRSTTVSGLHIENGGQVYLFASGTDISVESGMLVAHYRTVTSVTIGSGGSVELDYGAGASGTLVSGGTLSVGNMIFGEAVDTTVESGGLEIVYGAGQAFGTVVSSGGTLQLFSGAQVTSRPGEFISPFSGTGAAYAPPVFSGGTEIVDSGYAVDSVTVQGGGLQQLVVAAAGSASDLKVSSGGIVVVSSGGYLGGNSGVIVGSGGHITLHSGMNGADAVTVSRGGEYDAFGADAVVPGFVFSGGNLAVGSGKVLNNLRIGSAYAKNIPVTSVVNGGVLSFTVLDSPGSIVVESGGLADRTYLFSGTFAVQAGGSATATEVDSGAVATISSGGSLGGARIFGGMLDIQSGATTSGGITFGAGTSGHGGTLEVDAAPAGGGALLSGATISNFDEGDTINLAGIAYDPAGTATLGAGNELDITEGGKTYTLQLDPNQDYSGEMFVLSDPTGTDVTLEPAVCFVTGTLILTTRGAVAVEELVVGDLAVTASGATRPIRWLGHRTLDCRRHPRAHEVHPIRIAAHAFGENSPARELRLSPGHPVLVGADEDGAGGHLVPIMCLINGTSVRRVAVESVTYWHVELDAHDILLAEGLPAESYLDWGDRSFFTEGSDHALANPDFVVPGLAGRCRPVAVDGPVVEAERRRLAAMLSRRLAAACAWPRATENPSLSWR